METDFLPPIGCSDGVKVQGQASYGLRCRPHLGQRRRADVHGLRGLEKEERGIGGRGGQGIGERGGRGVGEREEQGVGGREGQGAEEREERKMRTYRGTDILPGISGCILGRLSDPLGYHPTVFG